ncbi:uncharacterized protein LOC122505157 [Leptopilina heterotoma]|uniref:uncharacterized protein LOC122505157 n=1 Tax=Leptopilina heterotoma TaxID=63436 RepID=UPI001CA9F490|nr:uncharacterized protein LOC122505157 [Leptopilina heterotoma]
MKTLVIFLCLGTTIVFGNPVKNVNTKNLELMETKLRDELDELNKQESINIYGNIISLEKISIDEEEKKELNLENGTSDPLVRRIDEFLKCRKIQVSFPHDGSSADFLGRAIGERNIEFQLRELTHNSFEARTKLKRVLLPLLLVLKLKALIILPIIITIIGLIGIKGLGAGLMALLLSGAVALKALLTPPPPLSTRISYGIVKPHDIYHDHWHRSQEEVNQPYRGWSPDYPAEQYPYQEVP